MSKWAGSRKKLVSLVVIRSMAVWSSVASSGSVMI